VFLTSFVVLLLPQIAYQLFLAASCFFTYLKTQICRYVIFHSRIENIIFIRCAVFKELFLRPHDWGLQGLNPFKELLKDLVLKLSF